MCPAVTKIARIAAVVLHGAFVVAALSPPAIAQVQQAAMHDFDLNGGPVQRILPQIGQIAGISVIITDGGTMPAAQVRGRMTADDAIATALAATGLRYEFSSPGMVIISAAPAATDSAAQVTLQPVVITATGFAQQLADAPASVTVIPGNAANGRAYRGLIDVLDDRPGIAIEGSAKTGADTITIRSMAEDYVLLLIDGRPLGASQEAGYNGWASGMKTGFLPPPPAIDRVEVIRGPMSSLYGTAATGGVVNVITRPTPQQWSGHLTLGATLPRDTAFGQSGEGRFYIGGPLIADRLGFALYGSANSHAADTPDLARQGDGLPHSIRQTLGAKLNWQISEQQSLDLDMSGSRQRLDHTDASASRPGGIEIDEKRAAISHRLQWNGAETVSYASAEHVDLRNGALRSEYANLGLNTTTRLRLNRHALSFGWDYRHETTRHDRLRFQDSISTDLTRWQWALFAEDEITLSPDFALTLGARYDRNQNYGAHVTPRIYGVWRPTDALTFKGGISGGYKVPALKQADSQIVEPSGQGAGWDRGNDRLRPERSTNLELGMVWDAPGGAQLGLTAYRTAFTDKIDREYICESPDDAATCSYNGETRRWLRQYVNRDRATLNGVEATLDVPIGPADLALNYTYSDSRIDSGRDRGQPLNDLPRHMFNMALDWQATEALGIWGKLKYRSATMGSGPDRIPGYGVLDVGLTRNLGRDLHASMAIYNALDRYIDTARFGRVIEGRRIYLGISSEF